MSKAKELIKKFDESITSNHLKPGDIILLDWDGPSVCIVQEKSDDGFMISRLVADKSSQWNLKQGDEVDNVIGSINSSSYKKILGVK